MIELQLHNTNNTLDIGFIWKASRISSYDHGCRMQQTDWHNALPHEAPHMLKVAYECLAEEHILCLRHIFGSVVSVVVVDIKGIKHVKHKARMPFRHVVNAILEHLHM